MQPGGILMKFIVRVGSLNADYHDSAIDSSGEEYAYVTGKIA